MTTHIQRQTAVVEALKAVLNNFLKVGGKRAMVAARSTMIQRRHIREMESMGYTNREGEQSYADCRDMARLELAAEGKVFA